MEPKLPKEWTEGQLPPYKTEEAYQLWLDETDETQASSQHQGPDKTKTESESLAGQQEDDDNFENKKDYDKKREGSKSNDGESVLVYNMRRADRKSGKSANSWLGPYNIARQLPNKTFELANNGVILNLKNKACLQLMGVESMLVVHTKCLTSCARGSETTSLRSEEGSLITRKRASPKRACLLDGILPGACATRWLTRGKSVAAVENKFDETENVLTKVSTDSGYDSATKSEATDILVNELKYRFENIERFQCPDNFDKLYSDPIKVKALICTMKSDCPSLVPDTESFFCQLKILYGPYIGTCGLHVLHNAFKDGVKESGWEFTSSLLKSVYYLFQESPARRDEALNPPSNQDVCESLQGWKSSRTPM
ncbi:hypothetical protein EGW08_016341 [Elysia chlorotica]|uniref:Uncharacterized protein n=1 Tax=Elysia chlorotica TaxID=188477 RepID=A0A3S0ZEQ5_ELYCH|nr:hypothetical protein EGW08_016341 [Elysia chlorotica]